VSSNIVHTFLISAPDEANDIRLPYRGSKCRCPLDGKLSGSSLLDTVARGEIFILADNRTKDDNLFVTGSSTD